MDCPACGKTMEYEEIKWPCGVWYCPDCDKEYEGEYFACGADENGINDYEERIGEEIKKGKCYGRK